MPLLMISMVILLLSVLTRGTLAKTIATSSHPEPLFWIRDIACILLASALSCLAMEAWNDGMSQVVFMYARHEFLIVLVAMAAGYLVAFRSGMLMALVSSLAAFIGAAQHYVWKFRGTPIIPTDISPSSLSTAGEVAGEYNLTPDDTILLTIALGILAVAVSLLVRRPRGDGYAMHVMNVVREFRAAFARRVIVAIPVTGEATGEIDAPVTDGTVTDGDADDADDVAEDSDDVAEEPVAGDGTQDDDGEDVPPEADGNTDEDAGEDATEETDGSPDGSDEETDGTAEQVTADDGDVASDDEEAEKTAETGGGEDAPDAESDDGGISLGDAMPKARVAMTATSDRRRSLFRKASEARARRKVSDPARRAVVRRRASCCASPLVTCLVAYAVISGGLFLGSFDYEAGFPDMVADWWAITSSYRKQGTLTTFAMLAQTTKVGEPRGWDEVRAQAEYDELVAAYEGTGKDAPTGSDMPDIIGIMSESYCDMTVYDRLELPVEAAPRFMRTDAPEGIIDSGRMRISVFGGRTANSEYEFLTGDCLIGLGMSTVPFASYNLSEVPSLVRQLSELGYGTYAIHPCDERNWDRNSRYPELGFDEFLSEPDFHEAGLDEEFHGTISDGMCYEMAKRVLDEREDSEEPTFIWDVTVQNHGGYDKGNIPENQMVDWDLSMLSDDCATQLREYMSGAQNSTDATLELLEDLEDRERPTVVVFYGDHQPVCNGMVVNEIYGDIDGNSVAALEYQTCYFIWENKAMREQSGRDKDDDEDEDDDEDSEERRLDFCPRDENGTNTLAACLLEEIGYPLTDFQKALMALRQTEARAMCMMGMIDPSSYNWKSMTEKDVPTPLEKLRDIDWLVVDRKLI